MVRAIPTYSRKTAGNNGSPSWRGGEGGPGGGGGGRGELLSLPQVTSLLNYAFNPAGCRQDSGSRQAWDGTL